MKISKTKIVAIISIFVFFITIPFFQSFFFTKETKGSIEINKNIKASFIDSDKKVVLLFFGYVGCEDVCTPFLYQLNDFYKSKEFESIKEDVEILFVNLTPETEKFQADLFAKFFNDDFRGVYLSKKELLKVDRNFALYFSRDLSDKTQLNHTDYIYLIDNSKENKVLKSIYFIHPLNSEKLKNDIILLKENL